MCLLVGCMADDFWLCKVTKIEVFERLQYSVSLGKCKHWDEKIILKLHKNFGEGNMEFH